CSFSCDHSASIDSYTLSLHDALPICVSDLSYDINYHVWIAMVHGSDQYFVEISTDRLSEGARKVYCDCTSYDTNRPCKHIAAVLIAIKYREATAERSVAGPKYEKTNQFIRAITAIQPRRTSDMLPEKIPLHIEYDCHVTYDQYVWLDLKAGVKRTYVVKDLLQF